MQIFIFDPVINIFPRDPDHPVSLFEGWAGAVVFCTDILFPNQAAFPFNDVFI